MGRAGGAGVREPSDLGRETNGERVTPYAYLPRPVSERVGELLDHAVGEHGGREVMRMLEMSNTELDRLVADPGGVTFPMADKIVTRLYGPDWWHLDPVLAEWYKGPNVVAGVRLALPGRDHRTPCRGCGCDPDLRTIGCRACNTRMSRRRRINARFAA